jgi:outer membrane protein assembly factor BamA
MVNSRQLFILPLFQYYYHLYFSRHIASYRLQGICVLFLCLLYSCTPARYIPEGNYLLSKNKVETSQKSIPEEQLKSYILQKPNKKLLGMRFYLFLYSLSDIHKEKWPHNWLRKIGEEPVIYNPGLTSSSTGQLRQFLENKGYYHAVVNDTVEFKGKHAKVYYEIRPNEPYRIQHITYFFEDTGLVSKVQPDTVNSLLKAGMIFDKDVMQQERIRIETHLKELGYFHFSKEYIFFHATMDEEKNSVDLEMGFKEYVEGFQDPRTKVKQHPKYLIGNVYIYPDFSTINSDNITGPDQLQYDTTLYNGLYFLYNQKARLKPAVIANSNYIIPGQYYKLSDVNKTYRNLSELNLIRYTDITFKEKDTLQVNETDKLLDCRIELSPKKIQSIQPEVSGTNSAGDLGIRGNLLYQNLNLFRGAEVLNLRINGAIESLKNQSDNKYKSMKEVGAESNIVFPRFFSPFRLERFVQKYSPKTSISVSFNYQSRPDYTRSIANGSFSYRWNGSQYLTHTVWPLELNYVQIYEKNSSSEFLDSIKNTPLGYSFEDHLVNVIRYGFELNNQTIGKSKDFIFTRFNIESAGNIVNLVNSQLNHNESTSPYQLFKVPYFQYLRGDIDLRYYNVVNKNNSVVYRLFIGVGYPFGNSKTMPFEKKYFAGGPNSIRAWSTRDLGPGSYVEKDTSRNSVFYFPNKSGDIKLEANLEYRFKVIWKMEGAVFLDAGNIWEMNADTLKPNAEFNWKRFHKEIAVGSGIGFRFDFSFFLLRLDFGIKLRDPALMPENKRWIPVLKDFSMKDLHLRFGIGYPF